MFQAFRLFAVLTFTFVLATPLAYSQATCVTGEMITKKVDGVTKAWNELDPDSSKKRFSSRYVEQIVKNLAGGDSGAATLGGLDALDDDDFKEQFKKLEADPNDWQKVVVTGSDDAAKTKSIKSNCIRAQQWANDGEIVLAFYKPGAAPDSISIVVPSTPPQLGSGNWQDVTVPHIAHGDDVAEGKKGAAVVDEQLIALPSSADPKNVVFFRYRY